MQAHRKINKWNFKFRIKTAPRRNAHLTYGHKYGLWFIVYPWQMLSIELCLGMRSAHIDIWHDYFRWEGE